MNRAARRARQRPGRDEAHDAIRQIIQREQDWQAMKLARATFMQGLALHMAHDDGARERYMADAARLQDPAYLSMDADELAGLITHLRDNPDGPVHTH